MFKLFQLLCVAIAVGNLVGDHPHWLAFPLLVLAGVGFFSGD